MKKIVYLVVMAVLVSNLVGCFGNKPSDQENTPEDTQVNEQEQASTLLDTQTVAVEYVGQIDNNSIEVIIEDGPRALRLNGIAKEQLAQLQLEPGDIIKVEVFKNENDQETVYSMEKQN